MKCQGSSLDPLIIQCLQKMKKNIHTVIPIHLIKIMSSLSEFSHRFYPNLFRLPHHLPENRFLLDITSQVLCTSTKKKGFHGYGATEIIYNPQILLGVTGMKSLKHNCHSWVVSNKKEVMSL